MTKVIKIITVFLIFTLVFNQAIFLLAQTDANEEIREVNKEIQAKRDRIKKMQEQQEVYKQLILKKQAAKANLLNQLAILENRLAKAELDVESAETEIDRTNLEIKKVKLEIDQTDKKINHQKEQLEEILRLIQRQDEQSILDILLLNDSLTDFLSQVKYLEDINNEVGRDLENLKRYKQELNQENLVLLEKGKELSKYKSQLEEKKINLVGEQQNKEYILDQTKSSEREYQRLLKLARAEQEQAAAEIVSLEKLVRAKLAKIQGKDLEFNDAGFIWPIKNIIVAYFHDPDYPFRYIFEHPAIDIRAVQGTPIRAAASGYVARAKDAGKGYSYIMIIHGNGLATVYGHVSRIYVTEDEYVVQGQTIGLSGGLPGTNGAGWLTTGPHLHLEIRLNGIPVNPLEYLP